MKYIKRTIVAVAVIGLLVFAFSKYREIAGISSWTTTSPREQAGFRLVAIQRNMPIRYAYLPNYRFWASNNKSNTNQFFWIQSTTPDADRLLKNRNSIQFGFMGKDGTIGTFLWFQAQDMPGGHTLASIDMPMETSPNYHDGYLIASTNKKIVAKWKISGMPEPVKQIEDNTKIVATGDALGFRVELVKSRPYCALGDSPSRYPWRICGYYLSIKDAKTGKPIDTDKYNVQIRNTRSSWASNISITDGGGFGYSETTGEFQVSSPNPFLSETRRMEYEIDIQKLAFHDEQIEVKNLGIERMYWDRKHSSAFSFYTTNSIKQDFETPSGVKLTIPAYKKAYCAQEKELGLGVQILGGHKKLTLPNSPIYQQYRKPVDLVLFHPSRELKGNIVSSSSGNDYETFDLIYNAKAKGDRWTEPAFPVIVRQMAVIEEGKVKLMLPLEQAKPSLGLAPLRSLGGGKAKAP